jgi:glycosyltransferase involved in cell wall biosynthesis
VVVTTHGVDVHALAVAPVDALRRFVVGRSRRVVAVSDDLAHRIRALDPAAPVDVVPMGANLEEIPTSFERAPEPGRVAFVGRLAEKKGVSVLIQALATRPELQLTIAGDGPERNRLQAQVERLGMGDRVDFLGHADRSQVYDLLARCEVLAIPSVVAADGDQEGTPVVLAEAVALGVPVVASRLGGLADQLDDETGWLVEPGDADQLGTALDEIHGSPTERDRRATRAREVVSPRLDLSRTVEAYTTLYRECL